VRARTPRLAGLFGALLALLLAPKRGAGAEERSVLLTGPSKVQGLLRADVDGDGVLDLLVLEGRSVWLWRGRSGALPAPSGRTVVLPDDVSAVDVAGGERLLVLGTSGARLVDASGRDAPSPPSGETEPGARPGETLAWRDAERATFADLVRGDRWLLPTSQGWRLAPPGGDDATTFEVEPLRHVASAGPFLEDSAAVTWAWPEVLEGAGGSLWAVSGNRLLGRTGAGTTAYDLSFLPGGGERRLADLDADGVPDVIHGEGTNQELRVAFFRTPPPPEGGGRGGDLKPPLATLHLTGFPIDPRTLDLDGDGRPDFVVTTIEIDTKNVLLAVTKGIVTASTRAFLNRRSGPSAPLFASEPDATVTSDIGVRIRFGYAGNFEIQRSFTIVVDGDYDGDGRKDLLIRTAPAEMTLRRGVKGGVWEEEGRRLEIPAPGASADLEGFAADLDGDRKDEVVLLYRGPPGGKDRIFVVRP
jgi:hypothetical protein